MLYSVFFNLEISELMVGCKELGLSYLWFGLTFFNFLCMIGKTV